MGDLTVAFSVPLVRGKARPRVTAHGTYTPRATREAEAAVQRAYIAACRPPYPTFPEGPVSVALTVRRPLPKSRPRGVASEPDTVRPDVDNISKLVLDALNGVAWSDDAQVTFLLVEKLDRERGSGEATEVVVWQ